MKTLAGKILLTLLLNAAAVCALRDSGAWPPSKNSKKAFINRQGYGIIETASKAVEYRPDPV